jgi:molybdopterin converting factor small subunit
MANILIPTALRAFTDGKKQVDVPGGTAGDAIEALAAEFPDIRKHLYDDEGKLRSYVNVFIGDENIRDLGGLAAPVAADGTLSLAPTAIAGELK